MDGRWNLYGAVLVVLTLGAFIPLYLRATLDQLDESMLRMAPTLRGEDRQEYLLVLPYEGISNQVIGILRGWQMARILGRKLLIPPLVRSQHEEIVLDTECPILDEWREHLDFSMLLSEGAIFMTDCAFGADPMFRTILEGIVPVYSWGRWSRWESFGATTRNFINSFSGKESVVRFRLRWRPFKSPLPFNPSIEYLASLQGQPVLVLAQLQHAHFPPALNYQATAPKLLRNPLKTDGLIPDIGIHWRRGDFELACANKDRAKCWPDVNSTISTILSQLSRSSVQTVWLASDAPDELDKFQGFAPHLTFLQSSQRSCNRRYFEDMSMLQNSRYFFGNQYSTFSRLVYFTRRDNSFFYG